MMTEEHKMIFEMLKAGTITVDEAEKLMSAVPEEGQETFVTASFRQMPKRLVVRVDEGGRSRVNVKIPFPIVRAALKLGQSFGGMASRFSGTHDAAVLDAVKNIDMDEILTGINDGELMLPATIVDIDVEEEKGLTHVMLILE